MSTSTTTLPNSPSPVNPLFSRVTTLPKTYYTAIPDTFWQRVYPIAKLFSYETTPARQVAVTAQDGFFPHLPDVIPPEVTKLVSEVQPNHYRSPEVQCCAAIAIMVNKKYTHEQIKAVFDFYQPAYYRTLRSDSSLQEDWISNVIENLPAESKTVKKIQTLRQRVADTPPSRFGKGPRGREAKQTLQGALAIAEKAGTLKGLGLPITRLRLETGLSKMQVSRGRARLCEIGVFKLVSEWTTRKGNTYDISAPEYLDTIGTYPKLHSAEHRICTNSIPILETDSHDIFTVKRLGDVARGIYYALKNSPNGLSKRELSEITGYAEITIKKYLNVMSLFIHYIPNAKGERYQMVQQIGKARSTKYTIGSADLDEMSRVFGRVGALERKQRSLELAVDEQRKAYQDTLTQKVHSKSHL